MKQQSNSHPEALPFNVQVKEAYIKILKHAKQLLATIEQEELRYMLTREDKQASSPGIVHELINPLLYLRLESHPDGNCSIHFGWELSPVFGSFYPITAAFVRFIYKVTMANNSLINIEDAVRTDWVITNPSELYEHVEEHNRYHTFQLIKYKQPNTKRKLRKVA